MPYQIQAVLRSSRHSTVVNEHMKLANAIVISVFISAVLATSVSLAEPANKEAREVEKDPDLNGKAETRKGASREREQLEAEHGSCGSD